MLTDTATKPCAGCQQVKLVEEYGWKSQGKNLRQARCRTCRAEHPERHAPTPRAACDRCGTMRAISEKARPYNLCNDCRSVLSKNELQSWKRSDREMRLWKITREVVR